MNQDAEQLWVNWWCNPWPWAHPAWQDRFAEVHGVSIHDCEALLTSRHGVFLQSIGIVADQPPQLDEPVLSWLALSPSQREQAIALAQCICFSLNESEDPDGQWCRGFSKALRPEVWLDLHNQDARLLLGAWLGARYWSRLRLAWPPEEVADTPCKAPYNKLQTLWQAVLWRVSAA
ncbi:MULTISPECIES: hypothetical protein [Pseudomonas syringae group]|uniref:Type III secretion protein n=1 Tax=Pseudomonas coronafaciens pv. coronafaciens TaxID=235275 RepID=A0AAE6QIQ4_9PSED|nr:MULTISPECIES: hypothetical protein [Pseudomonas syringae group]KPZ29490.1 Type III secretion protein HrpD [Pseudomonas coronafaciens pv. zizaniae]MCF5712615.1 type III secretion protein [Pseudomonas tremae]MCF5745795.1 type III secretion protein [Pseudomonas tremae]MCQ3016345.1 type III secretion protein [Pseudomonas tremae]QGL58144.1 type III secretion protein [Pseudomonas coronafaciens pv. oryzae str. 1_6]